MAEIGSSGGILDKKRASEDIELPGNPLKLVSITLARDELLALGINVSGTAALGVLTGNPFLIASSGPVIEKAGFFAFSLKEELNVYKTTPKEERESKLHYVSEGIKNGMPSFWRDLIGHDPVYTASMLSGLHVFPDTPAWMLSFVTFIGAIGVVAVGDVALTEVAYQRKIRLLQQAGFSNEPHLEAKFKIDADDPEKLIEELAEHFGLGEIKRSVYHDRYFPDTHLKTYNGREPAFRIRNRTSPDGTLQARTAQVIYTRASQVALQNTDQFNYFPRNKDKLRMEFPEDMPDAIADIRDDRLRTDLGKLVRETTSTKDVFVERDYASIPRRLLISVDRVNAPSPQPHIEIELKTYRDNAGAVDELIMAMRHIMRRYDVSQTTRSKGDLAK